MTRIIFPKSSFDHFYSSPLDLLDEEISRASIRLKLQDAPGTGEDRKRYQIEVDKLAALKYISQLRRGKLNSEDFRSKVELTR